MTNTAEGTGELAALRIALRGQYAVDRELGRGGMGIVVLARDERLDRQVALKVLPPSLADVPETRERFLREARMSAQLSHPNIVPIYRADEIGGFAFFAMGYVDGETLGDRIRDRGTLPPDEVVRVLREVAWALTYAHARGIVHRDVKPENILIERSTGRAVVTDFGIARSEFNPSLTQDGTVLGTVHYMSPEQCAGEPLDGRSDLYAMGCVGFFALSGRLPFDGTTPQAIILAHATKIAPALLSVAPEVPSTLAEVIDRCLAKRPEDRYTPGELFEALSKASDALQHESISSSGEPSVISSDDAMLVWRRAAELQAEAAARLDARMRSGTESRSLALPAGGSAAATSNSTASAESPSDAYRLRDVEAAAAEAGISQRYVALALAELKSSPDALQMRTPVSARVERLSARMFGTSQHTISVSRVIRSAPRDALQALGRTMQAPPFGLTLRDTFGGHPLDGGVLVFDIPSMIDQNYRWSYVRYAMFVKEVRVSLAPIVGDPNACEVSMHLDLRPGLRTNIFGYAAIASTFSGFGGLVGLIVAKKAMALAGVAMLGPVVGGVAAVGLGVVAVTGVSYRWSIGKAQQELATALAAIDTSIRAFDIFGESAPKALPPKSSTSYLGY